MAPGHVFVSLYLNIFLGKLSVALSFFVSNKCQLICVWEKFWWAWKEGIEHSGCWSHVVAVWTYYNDIIMGTMASQITSITIVFSIVYSDTDQRKHQSSASLAFMWAVPGEFPAQMASNAQNVSIWWRHHVVSFPVVYASNPVCCHQFMVLICGQMGHSHSHWLNSGCW